MSQLMLLMNLRIRSTKFTEGRCPAWQSVRSPSGTLRPLWDEPRMANIAWLWVSARCGYWMFSADVYAEYCSAIQIWNRRWPSTFLVLCYTIMPGESYIAFDTGCSTFGSAWPYHT